MAGRASIEQYKALAYEYQYLTSKGEKINARKLCAKYCVCNLFATYLPVLNIGFTDEELSSLIQECKRAKKEQVRRTEEKLKNNKQLLTELRENNESNTGYTTYRCYQSAQEVLEDLKEHGPMLLLKGTQSYVLLEVIRFPDALIGKYFENVDSAFVNYEWQDGTPFGRIQ